MPEIVRYETTLPKTTRTGLKEIADFRNRTMKGQIIEWVRQELLLIQVEKDKHKTP